MLMVTFAKFLSLYYILSWSIGKVLDHVTLGHEFASYVLWLGVYSPQCRIQDFDNGIYIYDLGGTHFMMVSFPMDPLLRHLTIRFAKRGICMWLKLIYHRYI